MANEERELVGWRVLGISFPCLAAPVYRHRLSGELAICFSEEVAPFFETVAASLRYRPFTDDMRRELGSLDPNKFRLLALGRSAVEAYLLEKEDAYFRAKLADPEFSAKKPLNHL